MKKLHLLVIIIFLTSCGSTVRTNIVQKHPPTESIKVIKIYDKLPDNTILLGTVKVGDSGFSTDCGEMTQINKIMNKGMQMGGDIAQIVKHKEPSALSSTCHRITAKIYKIKQ